MIVAGDIDAPKEARITLDQLMADSRMQKIYGGTNETTKELIPRSL
jgi:hypothetical protein